MWSTHFSLEFAQVLARSAIICLYGHSMKSSSGRKSPSEERYVVESVSRACRLLSAFQHTDEELRLKDLAERSGLTNATAFRLLSTLTHCGFVERAGRNSYRSRVCRLTSRRYRFGYACEGEDPSFVQEWTASIVEASAAEGIELRIFDNGYDAKKTLFNAKEMIKLGVDVAIEHLLDQPVARQVASRFAEAGIPLLAMGAAHPAAIYFGGDNFTAGRRAGRGLACWAQKQWKGRVEELLLLNLESAGPLLESRLRGVECGLKATLPDFDSTRVLSLAGSGHFGATIELVRRHLRRTPARRILVGAVNDPCALGALRALEESGWEEDCAVAGQGGSVEGREELRRPGSRLIGTVAYFPEKYGQHIIGIGLSLLRGQPVPPAVFTRHEWLTAANVDTFYPNDQLLPRRPVRHHPPDAE